MVWLGFKPRAEDGRPRLNHGAMAATHFTILCRLHVIYIYGNYPRHCLNLRPAGFEVASVPE